MVKTLAKLFDNLSKDVEAIDEVCDILHTRGICSTDCATCPFNNKRNVEKTCNKLNTLNER